VAVLSTGIGISCGMGKDEVRLLGIGALLHDVGKSAIPPEILNKPGRLNEREYELMKSHVLEGVRTIDSNGAVPRESRSVILQHHERISGTGYPNRLAGPRSPRSADLRDRGLLRRDDDQPPYKDAGTPFQALMQMKVEKANYDVEILDNFIRMLGRTRPAG
jgi:HD-GYP domain-containing protein (c-di-GMP phosphodiesterase class II)